MRFQHSQKATYSLLSVLHVFSPKMTHMSRNMLL